MMDCECKQMGWWFVKKYGFHWKFWKPLECLGGPLYFGNYYLCTATCACGKRYTEYMTAKYYETVRKEQDREWEHEKQKRYDQSSS